MIAVGLACMVALFALLFVRLDRASNTASAAEARLRATATDLASITQLRRSAENVRLDPLKAEDVLSAARETLVLAEIPAERLQSVTPEGSRRIADDIYSTISRQTIRLHVEPLSVAELGRLLGAWRLCAPAWRIQSIELIHGRNSSHDAFAVRLVAAAEHRGVAPLTTPDRRRNRLP